MRVKCLAHEHNAMTPARARTRAARLGDERTNHEATAAPTAYKLAVGNFKKKVDKINPLSKFLSPLISFIYGSFAVQPGNRSWSWDHLRSNLGIICGTGIICGPGSFAAPYGPRLKRNHPLDNCGSFHFLPDWVTSFSNTDKESPPSPSQISPFPTEIYSYPTATSSPYSSTPSSSSPSPSHASPSSSSPPSSAHSTFVSSPFPQLTSSPSCSTSTHSSAFSSSSQASTPPNSPPYFSAF